MNDLYVVTGAGPVGWTVAEQLAGQGNRVRVLTRSGSGPEHPLVERLTVDVQDASQVRDAFAGATAVFHCIHGSSYTADAWRAELPRAEQTVLAAAGEAGAVVVFPESLYSYSEPDAAMTEDRPADRPGRQEGVRTELLRAREASPANTVTVVAGDFFGPRVRNSHGGERMVPPVLAGKKLLVIGSTDQPHSFTYVPDLAAAMIRAAQMPALWNKVWHAPTGPASRSGSWPQRSQKPAVRPRPKIGSHPGLGAPGHGRLFEGSPGARRNPLPVRRPFVMDSRRARPPWTSAPRPCLKQPRPLRPGGGRRAELLPHGRALPAAGALGFKLHAGAVSRCSAASSSGRPSLLGHQMRRPDVVGQGGDQQRAHQTVSSSTPKATMKASCTRNMMGIMPSAAKVAASTTPAV